LKRTHATTITNVLPITSNASNTRHMIFTGRFD